MTIVWVTALAEPVAGSRAGRGPAWWYVVLAMSVALNLCFLGGFVWSELHGGDRGGHGASALPGILRQVEQVLRRSGADPDQTAGYQALKQAVQADIRGERTVDQPLVAALWAELAKASPDQSRIDGLLDEINRNRRSTQGAVTGRLAQFLAGLPAAEREAFGEHMGHPAGHMSARDGKP